MLPCDNDTRDRRSALESLESCARSWARTREKRSDNARSASVRYSQYVYTCVHAPAAEFASVCATRWPWLWPYVPPPVNRSESTRRVYPPYSMYIDP